MSAVRGRKQAAVGRNGGGRLSRRGRRFELVDRDQERPEPRRGRDRRHLGDRLQQRHPPAERRRSAASGPRVGPRCPPAAGAWRAIAGQVWVAAFGGGLLRLRVHRRRSARARALRVRAPALRIAAVALRGSRRQHLGGHAGGGLLRLSESVVRQHRGARGAHPRRRAHDRCGSPMAACGWRPATASTLSGRVGRTVYNLSQTTGAAHRSARHAVGGDARRASAGWSTAASCQMPIPARRSAGQPRHGHHHRCARTRCGCAARSRA